VVVVVDYGMGNVYSVLSALRYLGCDPILTNNTQKILEASHLVLPGVGSFKKGMQSIRERGLDKAITKAVNERGVKILGICLGMQLLGSFGDEDGGTEGLNLIPNKVRLFDSQTLDPEMKIPHVGFNSVRTSEQEGLFKGLPSNADFYFTHSYRMLNEGLEGRLGKCNYGVDFLAAFETEKVCGAQFHPEKSQTNGLILLKNFLSL